MAFNAFDEDEKLAESDKRKTLLRLFSYLLVYRLRIFAVLLIMGFCITVVLLNPLFLQRAVDTYIAHRDIRGLIHLILLAGVLNVLMVIAVRVRMLLMAEVSNRVIREIRQELYDHIQFMDFSFFDSRPTGKLLARIIGDVNSLKQVIENSVTTFIPDLITVCCVAVIMLARNARLAAAALCSLPLMIAAVWIIMKRSHRGWQVYRKKSSNLNAYINESLSGIRVIQGFHAEQENAATFGKMIGEHRDSFIHAVRWTDAAGPAIDICWGIGTAALYFAGIRLLGLHSVSIGTYIAFGTYIGMFWQPIMNLSNFYNQLTTTISGAERIFEVIDAQPAVKDLPGARQMKPVTGAVEFDDVSFSYDEQHQVLENVSFTIRPGETIALVGPTGAGKSTIVNLISRFYDVTGGAVRIDGTDVREVTLDSLRSQMGIMTQDTYIFSGTVRDNIRYGNLDATDADILAAAEAVHAHDFITGLEHGYDTVLTARGGELSNGQRQLIAFARTMLSLPRILILDEATSSIDTRTEQLVQSGIAALLAGRTSFVIAHRLSTVRNADRIFVVDQGGILESGSPAELMEKKGLYYDLYTAQFSERDNTP